MRKNEAVWMEKYQRWQINVQKDGQRKSFTSSKPGKKGKIEAEKKSDEWMEFMSAKDIRFSQLWKEYLADIKENAGTGNYRNHEGIGRLYLLPKLQHKRVSAITLQDMQDCINDGYKKGLARKSCSNIRGSISAVYHYATRRRIKMESPDSLAIPKGAPVGEKTILQPADIKTLFTKDTRLWRNKTVFAHYIYAWRFAVLTGMRPGEWIGLKRDDIKDGVVHIKRARNIYNEETHGKNDNARRVFILPENAKKVLDDQFTMLRNLGIVSPWVFPEQDGTQSRERRVFSQWDAYRRQHNISSTLYEMRHTMISVVAPDLPEKLLKSIVGHSEKMDTLGTYGHSVDGEYERAAQIIDNAFKRFL